MKFNLYGGSFEPITAEEEVVLALAFRDTARASKFLHQIKTADGFLQQALADLLGGDAKAKRDLKQRYPYRIVLASWGMPGPKPRDRIDAAMALAAERNPPQQELAIFEALVNGDAKGAAKQLRETGSIGRFLLNVLADMLDGDVKTDRSLAVRYPMRLKVATWGVAGRRGKNYEAIGETSRRGTSHKAIGETSCALKKPKRRATPSNAFLASRVQSLVDEGNLRKDAIRSVAANPKLCNNFRVGDDQADKDGTSDHQRLSESAVSQAYDANRKKLVGYSLRRFRQN